MFIQKLKISNFKSFANEVVMDLNCNSRMSESDINENKFYKNKDVVLPRVVSITGANSVGKTSVLDAIDMLRMLLQPLTLECINIDKATPENKNKVLGNLFLIDVFQKFNVELKDPVTISNCATYDYEGLFNELQEFSSSKFNQHLGMHYSVLQELIHMMGNGLKEKWFFNKHNKNKETIIECTFYDDKLDETVVLTVNDMNNIFNINIDSDNKEMINKIKNIYKDIFYHNYNIDTHGVNEVGMQYNLTVLIDRLKIFFNETDNVKVCDRLVNLLKSVDPNIQQIVLNNNNNIQNGVNFINLKDGTNVTIEQLSTGTKKFIKLLVPFVVMLTSTNGGIILVDEIDNYLHQDLVDFFKKVIYQTNSSFQLFFTTHNFYVATSLMNNKQIFTIEEFEGEKEIRKTSKDLNPTKDPLRAFNAHIIGSHPFQQNIFDAIVDIIEHIKKR